MNFAKADLIIHPIRLRILQALLHADLTTQEIAAQLPDAPASSLYRHLRLLLDGGLIRVSDTQLVNGILEKRYSLAQPLRQGPEDVASMSSDDHLRYFTNYVLTLLQAFAQYLAQAADSNGRIDLTTDYVGYTEYQFFANPAELDALRANLQAALLPLMAHPHTPDRRKHKLAIITHPTHPTTNQLTNQPTPP